MALKGSPGQDTHCRKLPSALQIDDKQLRGYLSELRPVTIVFVNLMFKEQDKAEVIGSAIQAACVHITSVLKVFRGQINKVFMFDKVSMNYIQNAKPSSSVKSAHKAKDIGQVERTDGRTFNLGCQTS